MKNFTVTHVSFVFTGSIALILLSVLTSSTLQAVNYAETARGADVYALTQSPEVTVGQVLTVDILVTNDSTPLNAMEAELYFDPSLFQASTVAFNNSLCEERFIIDNVIDNITGRIHLSCGTVVPFTGNATTFATVTLLPQKIGIGNIAFGEKNNIYVHDGLGTQIIRDTYDTTLIISGV